LAVKGDVVVEVVVLVAATRAETVNLEALLHTWLLSPGTKK